MEIEHLKKKVDEGQLLRMQCEAAAEDTARVLWILQPV